MFGTDGHGMMQKRLNSLLHWSRSLSARIVFLMTIAMLPVGLVAVYQTHVVVENARAQNHAALMSQINAEAARETELLDNALSAAQGLAVLIARLGEQNCNEILKGFAEGNETYAFAGFVHASGRLRCSSHGQVVDMSDAPAFREAIGQKGPTLQVDKDGAATGRTVVLVTQPVWREGELIGLVALSIPHSIVIGKLDSPAPSDGLRLAAFDSRGQLVAATFGLNSAPEFLPRDMEYAELLQRPAEIFDGVAGSGERRLFAVTPMIDDQIVMVGSWPLAAMAQASGTGRAWFATLLPVLMWLAGVGVALFGMDRMVIRHVAQLRSAMRRFALGDRDNATLRMKDPPVELKEAERAFNRMALLIAEGEQRREQDLRDKEVLLREVHHRVKNNLQLIASIMNMQSRELDSDEAKHAVAELQRRVRSMAVLHRALYNTPSSTTVDAAELLRAVVADAQEHCDDDAPEIGATLETMELYPDQAVPLSLLVAETLNDVLAGGGCDGSMGDRIRVDLSRTGDDEITFSVEATLTSPPDVCTVGQGMDGLGRKMMSAFLRQLDGTMESASDGKRYHVSVTFPRVGFSTAPAQ